MIKKLYFLLILWKITANTTNLTGRSYYFKTRGNNEFTVYNRIHFLNHNISDFDVNPHYFNNDKKTKNKKETIPAKITTTNNTNQQHYLDPEWHYDNNTNKPINRTNYPIFIQKFYEHQLALLEENQLATSQRMKNSKTIRILFNVNHKNASSRIIKLNLNSVNPYENVSDAELYFYWSLEPTSRLYRTSVVLRLYQIEQQIDNQSNDINNPDLHKLFNVIYISKAHKGWQTFKIKKPMDNWLKSKETNLGLLLTISDENDVVETFNDTNDGIFRTFAVLYIENNSSITHSLNRQHFAPINPPFFNHPILPTSNSCTRKSWKIEFAQFHWNNFILYPENGYDAHQCSGICSSDHLLGNNHQHNLNVNYIKLKQWNLQHGNIKEKRIYCVPTIFASLPIMFIDRYDNIVLKNYDNMIVEKCGCR